MRHSSGARYILALFWVGFSVVALASDAAQRPRLLAPRREVVEAGALVDPRTVGQKTTRKKAFPEYEDGDLEEECKVVIKKECKVVIKDEDPSAKYPLRRQNAWLDLSKGLVCRTPSPLDPLPEAMTQVGGSPDPKEKRRADRCCSSSLPPSAGVSEEMAGLIIEPPFDRHQAIKEKQFQIIRLIMQASGVTLEQIEDSIKSRKASLRDQSSVLAWRAETQLAVDVAEYVRQYLSTAVNVKVFEQKENHQGNPECAVAVIQPGSFYLYPPFYQLSAINKRRELQRAIQGVLRNHEATYLGIRESVLKQPLSHEQREEVEVLLGHLRYVQIEEADCLGRDGDPEIARAQEHIYGKNSA